MDLISQSIIVGTISDELRKLIENLKKKAEDHEIEGDFLNQELEKFKKMDDQYTQDWNDISYQLSHPFDYMEDYDPFMEDFPIDEIPCEEDWEEVK